MKRSSTRARPAAPIRAASPGSARSRRSYPSRAPVAPLDRIYFDDRLALRDCGTVTEGAARIASDHLPIWADLDFVDAA